MFFQWWMKSKVATSQNFRDFSLYWNSIIFLSFHSYTFYTLFSMLLKASKKNMKTRNFTSLSLLEQFNYKTKRKFENFLLNFTLNDLSSSSSFFIKTFFFLLTTIIIIKCTLSTSISEMNFLQIIRINKLN
jgi:hypothetical protein